MNPSEDVEIANSNNRHQQGIERMRGEPSVSTSTTRNPAPSVMSREDVHIRNFYTAPTAPYRHTVPWHAAHMLFRGAVGILLSIGALILAQKYQHAEAPYSNLSSFAIREASENEVSSIYDLKIDDMDVYAQAACAQGHSPSDVRTALQAQLSKIPKEARDEIVKQAVIDRVSTSSAHQNTKASISTNGRAHSYMAFWSTAYNGEMSGFSAKYTTCLMVSGIELSVAEQVAGSETTREMRQIGTKPCECGWMSCATCPVFEPYTVHTPIFKRHALSIRQQIELHRFMVKQATDQAKIVVGNRQGIGGYFEKLWQVNDNLLSLRWRGPNKNTFLGSDVTSDGSHVISEDSQGGD